jgi:hypothetical protein
MLHSFVMTVSAKRYVSLPALVALGFAIVVVVVAGATAGWVAHCLISCQTRKGRRKGPGGMDQQNARCFSGYGAAAIAKCP